MSGPRHGYDIIQFLGTALDSTWYVGSSQLYSVLKRLEREGLVRSSVETQEARPSKRVFSITAQGKRAFESWLLSPTEHVREMRVEFLAKLFFIRKFSSPGGRELINSQIHVLKRIREKMGRSEKIRKDPFIRLVYGFKLETINAWLKWLEREARPFIEDLPQGSGTFLNGN